MYYRFSIVNSCVTVLLLTGFLATILMRVLKNDFLKYTRDDDAAEEAEETGWKYIHGDVFRFPRHGESISFMMLCAIRLSPCVLFNSFRVQSDLYAAEANIRDFRGDSRRSGTRGEDRYQRRVQDPARVRALVVD